MRVEICIESGSWDGGETRGDLGKVGFVYAWADLASVMACC